MILGRFIGIDKFADPGMSDLGGCARDAAALYSIFKDGLADMDAELLTNEAVTTDRVRSVIHETLGAAKPGDAVILTLATHGTRDHHIVAHDSSRGDIVNTMLPLDELVDVFQTCQADFVFVILDCCFGGAAPARVVAGTPVSREMIDLTDIQGTGKLLLAASRMDEPAYEHPQRRHGLLTAALLDALTTDNDGVMSIVESVVSRVRADAASIGVVQNPVATVYIDGAFKLGTLTRGATFATHFPDYGQVTTTDINGIEAFGVPAEIVQMWSAGYGNHLHQLQLDAINEYRVLDGQSLFVVAPTSSAKRSSGNSLP